LHFACHFGREAASGWLEVGESGASPAEVGKKEETLWGGERLFT